MVGIVKKSHLGGYGTTTNPSYKDNTLYISDNASKPMILYAHSYVQKERIDQESNKHLCEANVLLMTRCGASHDSQGLKI